MLIPGKLYISPYEKFWFTGEYPIYNNNNFMVNKIITTKTNEICLFVKNFEIENRLFYLFMCKQQYIFNTRLELLEFLC